MRDLVKLGDFLLEIDRNGVVSTLYYKGKKVQGVLAVDVRLHAVEKPTLVLVIDPFHFALGGK